VNNIDPRLSKAFKEQNGFALEDHLILLAYVGSHSHGTYIPPEEKDSIDDTDFMGIVIPPAHLLLGLNTWDNWVWQFEELDVVLYSLPKAVKLLLKGNPNILGLLWLRREDYLFLNPIGRELIVNRDDYTSKDVYHSFIGYADGQLKKMTSFDAERALEYDKIVTELAKNGLTPESVIGADQNKVDALCAHNLSLYDTVHSFQKLHRKYFSGYMGEKRKGMVRKYGYDTKNAAHLLRLLRMGIEFMQTGVLQVFRTNDAQELIAIKKGAWTLEQVVAEANAGFETAKKIKESSTLPEKANTEKVERWLVRTLTECCNYDVSLYPKQEH
jgi:uncharacterized protein